ncbi:DUF805 domain-containing protein [Furfurilactobacillus entadae]|uniref:DUF805 domain-containing protein n=1 Tax=Furfurilactobacillus entadae TaxID=2922307 RepID=UPI0035F037D0
MNVWANYAASWRETFNYHGKTRRRDFWAAMIGMVVMTIVMATVLSAGFSLSNTVAVPLRLVLDLFYIAQFLPYLSMSVRRLHSINLPGRYQWLMVLPGVHMIVLHALPEATKDSRAPWYQMMSPDGEPVPAVVDRNGYVHGILANAFSMMWHNFFNFKQTTSRGNYLWSRLAWMIFSVAYGAVWLVVGVFWMMARGFAVQAAGGTSLDNATAGSLIGLAGIVYLSLLIPILSLTARRLHDQALSGWWSALILTGSIGQLIVTLLAILPAKADQQTYPRADGGVLKPVVEQPSVEVFYPTKTTVEAPHDEQG